MMGRSFWLAAMLLAAASMPLSAQTGGSKQEVKAPSAEAMALARLMSPRDLLIEMEVREFDKNFVSSLRADADVKSLDDEYPGLIEAMHKASRGLVAEATARSVDKIHVAVSQLIDANFTPADISELSEFYRSPTGMKTIRQMAANADASKIYERAVQEDDFKLTAEQISSQLDENARKTAATFTPEETTQMVLFMAKPSFIKLAKAQPDIQKLLADEFNAPDPEFDKQIETVMGAAVEQHLASFEKSGGK